MRVDIDYETKLHDQHIFFKGVNIYERSGCIKTWGNSQGIRIPKNILEKLGLHVSDTLQIEVIDDSIVLKKAFKHKTFEERVAEYNGEISICDYDWGEPVGKEIL